VQAPLNGNDLKRLGYKPGPHYKEMLDALLAATLDGVIQDEADAKAFLEQHYPLVQEGRSPKAPGQKAIRNIR
jgi:tRNA nucleotidyltransferase (CCA-adding enzyme)